MFVCAPAPLRFRIRSCEMMVQTGRVEIISALDVMIEKLMKQARERAARAMRASTPRASAPPPQ